MAEVKLPCEVGCELVAAVLGDGGPGDATAENERAKSCRSIFQAYSEAPRLKSEFLGHGISEGQE